MNKVTRYAVIETALCLGGNLHLGEVSVVRADEHDRELAALREELAADCVAHDAETDLLRQRLTAAEQRNGSLLEIARGLTIQLHATIGNTELHEDCIRDLEALDAKD